MKSMTFTETCSITPVAPFDLDLTAQIFASGDMHVRGYSNGVFQQVLQLESGLALAKLKTIKTDPVVDLKLELHSDWRLKPKDITEAQYIIRHIFNLEFNLSDFYREIEKNSVLYKVAQKLYGYKFPTTPTVFESLVDAIVEQQISIKVARTVEERLALKFGERLDLADETFFAFPTTQKLADATVTDIQSAGLSQRKAEYIHNVSKLIADGELELVGMKNRDPESVIAELDALKGIGVWTAELTILRGMQRWDVLPADDFGIRRVISTYCCGGRPIKAAEAREVAKEWGNWKGLAAFYLIMAEVHGIKP